MDNKIKIETAKQRNIITVVGEERGIVGSIWFFFSIEQKVFFLVRDPLGTAFFISDWGKLHAPRNFLSFAKNHF